MKDLDIFGNKFQFYHKGDDELKSKFGIILTVLYIICTGVATFLLGRNFFKRTNPNSSASTIFTSNYVIDNISKSNFSFAFRFEDAQGKPYENDQRVFAAPQIIDNFKSDFDHVSVRRCTDDDIIDKTLINRVNITTLFCIDYQKNNKLGGYWDSTELNYIYINIGRCLENTTNPLNNKPCDKEKNSLSFGNIYFSLFYQRVVFDNSNYENGIYPVLVNRFFNLDINSYKVLNIFSQIYQLNDDKGWIFESKKVKTIFGLNKEELNMQIAKEDGLTNAADIFFYGSREKTIYERIYPKISNVIAEVGGILGFFSVIFEFIGNKYSINYFVMNYFNENLNDDTMKTKRKSLSKEELLELEKKRSSQANINNMILKYKDINDGEEIYRQSRINYSINEKLKNDSYNNWLKLDSNNKILNINVNNLDEENKIKEMNNIDNNNLQLEMNKNLNKSLNKSSSSIPSRANKLDTSDFIKLDFADHLKKVILKNQDYVLYDCEVGFWEPLIMFFNLDLSLVLKMFCLYDSQKVKSFNLMYDKFTNTFELGNYIQITNFIKELSDYKEDPK